MSNDRLLTLLINLSIATTRPKLVGLIGRYIYACSFHKMPLTQIHITSIYIYPVIIQNKGYALGLALGRSGVSSVSQWWLWDLLLHEDLLLILLDHLLELMISDGHDLCQLVLNMHAMMMQHSISRQQQFLK